MGLLITERTFVDLVKRHRANLPASERSTMVFTNGVFDLLHPGHVRTLWNAKQVGLDEDPYAFLVVGINSDASTKRLKGYGRPIYSLQARAEILCALTVVDFVIPFEEDTPLELIQGIRPDIIVKSGEWDISRTVGAELVKKVVITPKWDGPSTTDTLNRIVGGHHW